jgi:hypothetical protein
MLLLYASCGTGLVLYASRRLVPLNAEERHIAAIQRLGSFRSCLEAIAATAP